MWRLVALMAYRSAVELLPHLSHGFHSLRSFHRMAIHGEPFGFGAVRALYRRRMTSCLLPTILLG